MTKTKRMQAPWYEGAPAIVREQVAFITGPYQYGPCPYEILLVEQAGGEVVGLDFGVGYYQGNHFSLKRHEAAAYRLKNGRKKIKFIDLPGDTQAAIIAYLESDA